MGRIINRRPGEVKQISDIPEPDFNLSPLVGYVAIGCERCPNRACFELPSDLARDPDSEPGIVLHSVPHSRVTGSGYYRNFYDDCEPTALTCRNEEDIEAAKVLIQTIDTNNV